MNEEELEPTDHDPKTSTVIPDFVRSLAAAHGRRQALVLDDSTVTFEELEWRSATLARGLLARGIGKGARIGILLSNSPEWVIWWAAISRVGAIVVPLSTFARAGELARVIRHADLHGIVVQDAHLGRPFAPELEASLAGLAASPPDLRLEAAPFLRWILTVGDDVPPWALTEEWLTADPVPVGLLRKAETEVHVDDPALTIYTSGTSATPKGVVHTQGAVVSKVHYIRQMLSLTGEGDLVANMPFFWVGGLVMTLFTGLEAGHRIVCRDASTYTVAAPLGTTKVVANPYENAKLAPALGMTETFGMYSWGHDYRVEGYPIASPLDEFEPGYAVDVVGEDGKPVADGEVGEIIVRGPTVTRQVVKADRDQIFTADGFLRTGDRGQRDGPRIHFVGRLGDMIKTSGANVAPPEVEQELLALDGVDAAYVVGIPHPTRGQAVVAAVVPTADRVLDPETIRATLRDRLSPYKVPRRIAVVHDSDIVRTPAQKVDRRQLGAMIDRLTRPASADTRPTSS